MKNKLLKERKEKIPEYLDAIEEEIAEARKTRSVNTTECRTRTALAIIEYVKLLQSMQSIE